MEVPKSLISKKTMNRTAKLWQNLIQLIAWPANGLTRCLGSVSWATAAEPQPLAGEKNGARKSPILLAGYS